MSDHASLGTQTITAGQRPPYCRRRTETTPPATAESDRWLVAATKAALRALHTHEQPSQPGQKRGERRSRIHAHGELAGVLDRAEFRQLVSDRLRPGNEHGLLLLADLDCFQELSETLGLQQAEWLFAEVSGRLQGSFAGATLARLSDDQFALLLPGATHRDLTAAAEILDGLLAEPLSLGGVPVGLQPRLGAAFYPEHGADVENLLRHASIAVSHAKQTQRPLVRFDERYERQGLPRLALLAELRLGLQRGELTVHYQPQLDLLTGRIRAVEALVRWQHPERGLLSAGEFIPAAEKSGLIAEIGRHVIATSIRQWREWNRHGGSVAVILYEEGPFVK